MAMISQAIDNYIKALVVKDHAAVSTTTQNSQEQIPGLVYPQYIEAEENCFYLKPPCSLAALMILVLQNTECRSLTYANIKQLICCLFPYYKSLWSKDKVPKPLHYEANLAKHAAIFLKDKSLGRKRAVLIMLNPVEEENWKSYLRNCLAAHMNEMKASMCQPDLFEVLVNGKGRLDSWILREVSQKAVQRVHLTAAPTQFMQHEDSSSIISKSAKVPESTRASIETVVSHETSSREAGTSSHLCSGNEVGHSVQQHTSQVHKMENYLTGTKENRASCVLLLEKNDSSDSHALLQKKNEKYPFVDVPCEEKSEVEVSVVDSDCVLHMAIEKGSSTMTDSLSASSNYETQSNAVSCVREKPVKRKKKFEKIGALENPKEKYVCKKASKAVVMENRQPYQSCSSALSVQTCSASVREDIACVQETGRSTNLSCQSLSENAPLPVNQVDSNGFMAASCPNKFPLLCDVESSDDEIQVIDIQTKSLHPCQKQQALQAGVEKQPFPIITSVSSLVGQQQPGGEQVVPSTVEDSNLDVDQELLNVVMDADQCNRMFSAENTLLKYINSQSVKGNLDKSASAPTTSVPTVNSCINTWKGVFPWLFYTENGNQFICKYCFWGSKHCLIFKVTVSSEVYQVAKHLRQHQDTVTHKTVQSKFAKLMALITHIYPHLKSMTFSNISGILEIMQNHKYGRFLLHKDLHYQVCFASFIIKYVGTCINFYHRHMLKRCLVFSVVDIEDLGCAIIRQTKTDGQCEEHFHLYKACSSDKDSALSCLQESGVDMTKLVSYTKYPGPHIHEGDLLCEQVPVCCPPLSVCLKWLSKTALLHDTFARIEALTVLCKTFDKFSKFPEAAWLAEAPAPYSYSCVVRKEITSFFFKHKKILQDIAQEIYNETKMKEAYTLMEAYEECDVVKHIVESLSTLCAVISGKNKSHASYTCQELEKYKKMLQDICSKGCSSDIFEVVHILSTYVTHVINILNSPDQENEKVFSLKIAHVTVNDMDKILKQTNTKYFGGSTQCLQDINYLCNKTSGVNKQFTMKKVLEKLIKSVPDIQRSHPSIVELYHRMLVLPCFQEVTKHSIDVYMTQMVLSQRISHDLLPALTLTVHEGPSGEDVSAGKQIIMLWAVPLFHSRKAY